MISHAQIHRRNLYLVQIHFSNAFGSVPHDLILSNMAAMCFPTVITDLVKNIYTDNSSKISLVGETHRSSHGQAERFKVVHSLRPSSIFVWKVFCDIWKNPNC
jgi:hypothetical protein